MQHFKAYRVFRILGLECCQAIAAAAYLLAFDRPSLRDVEWLADVFRPMSRARALATVSTLNQHFAS